MLIVIFLFVLTDQIVAKALERFGDDSNPLQYELHLVEEAKGNRFTRLFSGKPHSHVLADDESPVLVSEWYGDSSRRYDMKAHIMNTLEERETHTREKEKGRK